MTDPLLISVYDKKSQMYNIMEENSDEQDACTTDGESQFESAIPENKKHCWQRRTCGYYFIYVLIGISLWIIYAYQETSVPILLTIAPGLFVITFGTIWLHKIARDYAVELNLKSYQLLILMILSFIIFGLLSVTIGLTGNISMEKALQHLGIPVATVEELTTAIGAPIIEEIAKLIMVLIAFMICRCNYSKLSIDHVYYLQIIAICIGAGFGTIENFGYVYNLSIQTQKYGPNVVVASTAFLRHLDSVPFHCATPFIMMTVIGLVQFRETTKYSKRWILAAYLHSVILHMINNGGIVLMGWIGMEDQERGIVNLVFFAVVICLDLSSVRYWERKLIARMHVKRVGYSSWKNSACLCC